MSERNPINKMIHDLHSGLSCAEHQGDVARYLPDLQELERLIARIPQEPELLDGYDPEGIEAGYKAKGYVWCSCDETWCDAQDCGCGCGEE